MLLKLMCGVAPALTVTPLALFEIVLSPITGLVPEPPATRTPLLKLLVSVLLVRLTWELPVAIDTIPVRTAVVWKPPKRSIALLIDPVAPELKDMAPQEVFSSSVNEVKRMGWAEVPSATSCPSMLREPRGKEGPKHAPEPLTTTPGAMVRRAPDATATVEPK